MSTLSSFRRVVVVGATGCGKSTLAERLAGRLDLAYIELDALYWQPGWVGTPDEEFRLKVGAAIQAPGWALAGNYSRVRDLVWERADAILWLDYPFLLVFDRLLRRTWQRWRRRELLWGTNVEPLWVHLKLWSKESLINWLFQTYWRRKREYPQLFALPENAHLKVLRFAHPRELESWFASLPETGTTIIKE
jgi:adenylate kinase family enzyme